MTSLPAILSARGTVACYHPRSVRPARQERRGGARSTNPGQVPRLAWRGQPGSEGILHKRTEVCYLCPMSGTQYTDLYYLATAPEPTREEDRPLTLVYEAADGTRTYDVLLSDAWSYEGNPYELLTGRFEDYDGFSHCYFTERAR